MRIQIEDSNSSIAAEIEAELLKTLRESSEQSVNTQFVLSIKDEHGKLTGGLTASTSYGWLLIKTLWVDKAYRNRGYGKQLMQQAHDKGREIGCHSAWLDTSNLPAQQFYQALGYSIFGELSNEAEQFPANHHRYFMSKTLSI